MSAGTRQEFFSQIYDIIDENARDHIPLDVVDNSETYSNYECTDSDDCETSITNAGKEALKTDLRAADPALYQELFGT